MSAKDDKYNTSAKGQARNRRYENNHPERGQRNRTGFIARDGREKNDERDPNTASVPAAGTQVGHPGAGRNDAAG